MKLPLVDEIREARRAAEESHLAAMHLHRVQAALTSIDVTEKQLHLRADLAARVPGDDVVDLLSEHWPQLADLASHGGRPADPLLHQLAARRGQLELALQVLRPLAADADGRARDLHALQHRQRHLLEDARYADDVVELGDLGLERDRLAVEMTPIDSRLAMVQPALGMLDIFVDKLSPEATRGDRPDPNGLLAWRAVHLAHSFVDSFQSVLAHLQLDVPVPEPPDLPSAPDPDPVAQERIWAEVERVRAVLAELRAILAQEGETLGRARDTRKQRHEELTRLILERMG